MSLLHSRFSARQSGPSFDSAQVSKTASTLAVGLLAAGLACIALPARAAGYLNYQFIDLGNLNGVYKSVSASSLNDLGQVAGVGTLTDGRREAFVTGPGGQGMTTLGFLSGFDDSAATGINEAGQVVGTASNKSGDATMAFIYDPHQSGLRSLGTLGGASSAAAGINESGQVAGTSLNASGQNSAFLTGANGGAMKDLQASNKLGIIMHVTGVNNAGQIIGMHTFGLLQEGKGFLTGPDGTGLLTACPSLGVLNNLGQKSCYLTGTGRSGANSQYVYSYEIYSPKALNDKGWQVGNNGVLNAEKEVVFDWSTLPQGVRGVPSPDPRAPYPTIEALNNLGEFVLNGVNGHAYLVTTVPEPTTLASMLVGLMGVGLAKRRKCHQAG